MNRFLPWLFVVLAPNTAYAFPVVAGTITHSLLFFLLLSTGASSIALRRHRTIMASFGLVAALLGAYYINVTIATDALAMKAIHFPSDLSSTAKDNPDYSSKLLDLVSISEAKKLVDEGYVAIQIADTTSYTINGLNLYSANQWKAAQDYATSKNAKGLVLFSNYVIPAINFANELSLFRDNIVIVQTSKGTTYSNGIIESHAYISELLNDHPAMNGVYASTGLKSEPTPTTLMLHNESKHSKLSQTNVIVIGGDDLLKTYSSEGAKLLSTALMLVMKDSEWEALANTLDPNKSTLFVFTELLSSKHKYQLSAFALHQLRKYTEIPVLEYTEAAEFISLFPPLPTDNYITPYHFNSDRHMSATALYATQRHHDQITTICFTENCTDRLPPNSSSFNTILLNTADAFHITDFAIQVKTHGISKERPVVIITENAATSLLGYYLALELVKQDYHFLGFSNLYGGLFGGAYLNPLAKGSDAEFYYDDFRVRIDVAIQETLMALAPHEPIKTTSLWLVAIGAILGLGFSIHIFPAPVRAAAAIAAMYIAMRGDLWIQAPIEEYQQLLVPNWVYITLTMFVIIMGFDRNQGRLIKIALIAINATTITLLISLAFCPVLDRFYFGVLMAMSIVAAAKYALRSNPSKITTIGSKLKLTEPFVTGFKGYVANINTNLSWWKLLPAKEWIIRSNHLVAEESGAGGFFDSKVAQRDKVASTMKSMFDELKAHPSFMDANGSAQVTAATVKRKAQFWVMPFRKYKMQGCAESHYGGFSLKFAYAVSKSGAVTDGSNAEFQIIGRNTADMSKLDKKILAALTSCEAELEMPVSIEFGIRQLTSKIEILQVRPLQIHPSVDEKSLEVWRKNAKKMTLIDMLPSASNLSLSAVSALYGYEVVSTNEGVYRTPKLLPAKFDASAIHAALDSLSSLAKNEAMLRSSNFDWVVSRVAAVLKPVTSMLASEKMIVSGSNRALRLLIAEAYRTASNAGGMPESFDFDCKQICVDPLKTLTDTTKFSERDVLRYVTLAGFSILMKAQKAQQIDTTRSLSGAASGHKPCETPKLPNHDHKEVVVVAGAMPESICTVNELNSLSKAELEQKTLTCDFLPMHLMPMVPMLGGIICRSGTPLSHLAITAKHYGIPMVIKRD